ncbi:MAG: tetratricopeptide repeat protein [Desulfobacterales bacterium]
MNQIQKGPFSNQVGKYLYHKPGIETEKGVLVNSSPDHKILENRQQKITKIDKPDAYSNMLSSEAFLAYPSKRLEAMEHFDALMICPDPATNRTENGNVSTEFSASLMNIIDLACKSHSGFWGIYGGNRIACFVQTKTCPDAALHLAEKIHKQLESLGDETVSIGIAGYPQLSFKKEDIIENAGKALEHAHFLGQSSTVRFDAVSLNISGDKLYHQGHIEEAVSDFEQALLIDPKNVNVINSLGVCFGVKGEHQMAIDMFEKAMRIAPDDVMAPYNAGLAYLMNGDQDKALQFFLKAYALDQNQFEVVIQLGRLYLETKEPEKARDYLENAVAIDAKSGSAQRFLGECYSELNFYDKAVESYSKAIKLNANDAYSLSALACLYAHQGVNRDIAIVFGKQSVDLSPSTALFRQRLGKVYYLLKMYEEALKEFQCATSLGHDCQPFILEIENRLSAKTSDLDLVTSG